MVVLLNKKDRINVYLDRKIEEDPEEAKDIVHVVVYDHIVRRSGNKNDVLGTPEVHGQVPSMPNPMVHPNPSKHLHKADHSYRIEENLLRNFAVGTMVLLACRIEGGTRKKTVAVYENNGTNVDLVQAEVERTT